MTALSDTEKRILSLIRRKKKVEVDVSAVEAWTPMALIVGEGPGPNTRPDCPLFPYPGTSAGGRLLALSELEMEDYLCAFARRDLLSTPKWDETRARAAAEDLRREAELEGLPVILLGSRVADAFDHGLGSWEWSIEADPDTLNATSGSPLAPTVRIPHPSGRCRDYSIPEARANTRRVLRLALDLGAWPAFERITDEPMPCRLRPSAHPRHPRKNILRVLCAGDRGWRHRVVLPWGLEPGREELWKT